MSFKNKKAIVVAALAASAMVFACVATAARDQANPNQEKETRQRLREHHWWPTNGDAPRQDYAGSEACAACHAEEFASQTKTSMAHAAEQATDSSVLRGAAVIGSQSGDPSPYQTTIEREKHGSEYSVTHGGSAMRGDLTWAMGAGNMGQTYIVAANGALYEGHRTYFSEIKGLDQTPGQSDRPGESAEEAFGHLMAASDASACFACHTQQSSLRGQLDPSHAIPGVGCESCHGPGAKHIRAMQNNQQDEGLKAIYTPASLSPVEKNDYCGACHRAPLDVAAIKAFLPINIRFQPYRLSLSKCWSKPDERLTCTACHDPHEEVRHDAAFYDAKCLACHQTHAAVTAAKTDATAPACKVADKQCTSCHMPKYRVPSMHGSFTDHDIRIVRAGAPFPI